MATVTVEDARVHYDVTGAGPALVLVHGTGSQGGEFTFGQIASRFTDSRTVIMPDLSGTEATTDSGGPLTIEGLAAQVHAVIEHADAGPADMMGFSLGSPVAAAAAALRPDLVRRLVLAAGWSYSDGDEYLRNMFTLWRLIGDSNTEAFARCVTMTAFTPRFLNMIGTEQVEELVQVVEPTPNMLRQVDLNARVDIRDLLPRIRARTLVIGCARDATVPIENSRALHAALAGSAYAEVDSGHVAVFEAPEELARLVLEFVTA